MSNEPRAELIPCVGCQVLAVSASGQCCERCIDELKRAFDDGRQTEPRIVPDKR
jgi:hypothetical protein